jgi:hypothetical protein
VRADEESTMLDATISPHGGDKRHVHRTVVRTAVDERFARNPILARYLEGWAEANPAKILDATDPGYAFNDPLVGFYSRRTLPGARGVKLN